MLKYFLKSCVVTLLSLSFTFNVYSGVDFNGDADYITLGDLAVISTAEITIAAWIYPTANAIDAIVGKRQGSSDEYIFFTHTTGRLAFWVKDSSSAWRGVDSSNNIITLNTWQHVAVTFKNGELIIYVNGSSAATDTDAFTGFADTAYETRIGHHYDGSNHAYFDGIISEVAVWEKVLTAAEIKLLADSKLMGMPLQIQSESLQFYLPLDDLPIQTGINGDTFKDLSSNGNDGVGTDADGDSSVVGETILSYPPPIQ